MKVMDPTIQMIGLMLAISVPTLTAVIAILINNSRLSDLRASMTDLRQYMDMRFNAVDARFNGLDQLFTERLRRVEEVMDARLTRIEDHFNLR